jgi:hypothetical protein
LQSRVVGVSQYETLQPHIVEVPRGGNLQPRIVVASQIQTLQPRIVEVSQYKALQARIIVDYSNPDEEAFEVIDDELDHLDGDNNVTLHGPVFVNYDRLAMLRDAYARGAIRQ